MDVNSVFNYKRSVDQRIAVGGASKQAVLDQIQNLKRVLNGEKSL
jgi:hypothetical protein